MRLGYAYNVAIATTSAQGARVTPYGVTQVRLASTADCYVSIGTNPTAAVGTSTLIRSSVAGEVFTVGAGEQIAVISGTAGGTLNVTELTE